MKKNILFILIMAFITATATANAETINGMAIMKKAEDALSASRSGTRKLVVIVKDGPQVTRKFVVRNAYKEFPDGRRALFVFLEPDALYGTAHLFWKRTDNTTAEWVYCPSIRRVRSLSGLTAYDSFLGTDFTYSDLGLKDPGDTHIFLDEEMQAGLKAYKILTRPRECRYYSHIISWIATDTYLPIQRDYYDGNDRHWKTELFEHVVTIDNIPKPLKVRILDLQRNHSTDITISDICYDVEYLTKEDFNPAKLPEVTRSSVCVVRPFQKK